MTPYEPHFWGDLWYDVFPEDKPQIELLRSRRGFRVHALKESLTGSKVSLCDTGPKSTLSGVVWMGEPSDVTCPQCRKRLARDADASAAD